MIYDNFSEHAPSLSMLKFHVNLAGRLPSYAGPMDSAVFPESPGARLRQLRNMRDLTLEQVAAIVGISAQALSQIETGVTKNVRPENFLKLCAFYDVDPYKIALGKQKSEVASELRRRPTRNP